MSVGGQPLAVEVGNDLAGARILIPERPCGIRQQVLELVLVLQDAVQRHHRDDARQDDNPC